MFNDNMTRFEAIEAIIAAIRGLLFWDHQNDADICARLREASGGSETGVEGAIEDVTNIIDTMVAEGELALQWPTFADFLCSCWDRVPEEALAA